MQDCAPFPPLFALPIRACPMCLAHLPMQSLHKALQRFPLAYAVPMRLFYGYRFRMGRPAIVPEEAALVRVVLAAPPRKAMEAACAAGAADERGYDACAQMVSRILRNRAAYLQGQVSTSYPPNDALIIQPAPSTSRHAAVTR